MEPNGHLRLIYPVSNRNDLAQFERGEVNVYTQNGDFLAFVDGLLTWRQNFLSDPESLHFHIVVVVGTKQTNFMNKITV